MLRKRVCTSRTYTRVRTHTRASHFHTSEQIEFRTGTCAYGDATNFTYRRKIEFRIHVHTKQADSCAHVHTYIFARAGTYAAKRALLRLLARSISLLKSIAAERESTLLIDTMYAFTYTGRLIVISQRSLDSRGLWKR